MTRSSMYSLTHCPPHATPLQTCFLFLFLVLFFKECQRNCVFQSIVFGDRLSPPHPPQFSSFIQVTVHMNPVILLTVEWYPQQICVASYLHHSHHEGLGKQQPVLSRLAKLCHLKWKDQFRARSFFPTHFSLFLSYPSWKLKFLVF